MRPEIENFIDDLKLYFPGEDFHQERQRIAEMIVEGEIKYEYQEEKAKRPYGQAEKIKDELARKYHRSVRKVNRIIY